MRTIDHLVYCVPNLKKAIHEISEKCGVQVVYGGQHLTKGTENALLNIGNGAYLELLAIDVKNTDISPLRWMGIDLIDAPTFTRWAIKTTNLKKDTTILKKVNAQMGATFTGSRKKTDGSTLSWSMALPLAAPKVEILPFMVDWKDSIHPTETLQGGCTLIGLELIHPMPKEVQSIITALGVDLVVQKGITPTLKMTLDTPNGQIIL